jgi:hypothetical protein
MTAIRTFFRRLFEPGPGGASAGFILLFAAGLCAYAVVVCRPPAFDPLYALYQDNVSFYWIQAFWDRTLFAGDPVTAFYLAQVKPLTVEAPYIWLTALFMKTRPYTAGLKVLYVVCCAVSALLVRRLALASPARPAAGAAALLFTALFLTMDVFFGVPRAYGVIVLAGFAWAMEEKRFLLLPALPAAAMLFYPALAVGLGFSAALAPVFFWPEFSARRLLPRYLGALAAGALLCLLLLGHSGIKNNASTAEGRISSFESSKLYQRVETPLNPGDPVDVAAHFVLNINEHSRLYPGFMALLALIYGLGLLVAPRKPAMLPRSLPALLAGCGAAFLVLYPLHPVSASRQLVMVVPLALVFLAAEGLYVVFEDRLKAGWVALAFGLLFVCLHPWFNETYSMRQYAPAYKFMAALPPGGFVAGYPEGDLTVTTPIFTGRAVLMSGEVADQELMFLVGPQELALRRRAIFDALYCARPRAGAELAAAYKARWLVFEKKYYAPAFLARAAVPGFPEYADLAALLAGGADPAACYAAQGRKAAFAWGGENGGFIVDLLAPAGPAAGRR